MFALLCGDEALAAGAGWLLVVVIGALGAGALQMGAGLLIVGGAGILGTTGIVCSLTSTFVVGRGVNRLKAAAAACDGFASILTPLALGTPQGAFT